MTMTPQKARCWIAGASAAAALGALTAVLSAALPPAAAAAGDPAAALYKEKCVGCHGADGSGNTPIGKALKAGDLRSPAIQAKTDAQLAESFTKGKGKMPPQKVSREDANSLVAFIRALAKAKP
jgi:mono/diheme cytochrome c family protein